MSPSRERDENDSDPDPCGGLNFLRFKTNKFVHRLDDQDQALDYNAICKQQLEEHYRHLDQTESERSYKDKLKQFVGRVCGQLKSFGSHSTQTICVNHATSTKSDVYKVRAQISSTSSNLSKDDLEKAQQASKHNYFPHDKLSQSLSSASKFSKPPIKGPNDDIDCGYAWVILAIIFFINASTFGTARAYGLIFEKLAREDEQERSLAALPFTVMGALENMGGPLAGYLLSRTGSWRTLVFVGSSLITMSHLLTALSDNLTSHIFTMGLMCGIGLSFVSLSFFQINNAYFVRYRSTAFGFGLTGAAFGTLYISPLCQYVLSNYSTNACYLMLGIILLPNVPLSLLLRSKDSASKTELQTEILSRAASISVASQNQGLSIDKDKCIACTISEKLDQKQPQTAWQSIKRVLSNPMFHLIWPTQLMFCWLNFVFGMIFVDFGKDRQLDDDQLAQLVPIWAFGQLVGRICLGSLVDLKIISIRLFTVVCFVFISLSIWSLAHVKCEEQYYEFLSIATMVFFLSTFISNLYILLNSLVTHYMEKPLTALSLGISSFAGSFFLLPRAHTIGYYRDTHGNYDSMLTMFTYATMMAASVWLFVPTVVVKFNSRYRETYLHKTLNLYLSNLSKYQPNGQTTLSHLNQHQLLTIITASET